MRFLIFFIVVSAGCGDCSSNNEPTPDGGADMSALPDGFAEPFDPSELGWGLHVTARSSDDIYVAGGTPDRGVLLHSDGGEFAPVELPEVPLLNWVAPLDGGAVVVVGSAGTILMDDGGGWSVHESGTEEDLWGVWGASSQDLWAVGGRGRADGQATVLRYDGTEWAPATVPALMRPGVNAYFKVWGTAADNVYIVGQNGGCLRWDGTDLTEFGVGTSEDLISLWGTGPDDIVLVGGRGNGVMSHWDGTEWFTASVSPAPGINGVWMGSPGEFWIAGVRGMLRRGTVNADTSGARSFDVPRAAPLSENDLHAVFGVPGYGLLAVGGNFEMQSGPYEGVALLKTEDF